MPNQENKDPNQHPQQQGAPQNTQDMPSSGNSPRQGASTDEGMNTGQDVERSGGGGGTATQRSPQTGDPGRTPGKAEGEENAETKGNE